MKYPEWICAKCGARYCNHPAKIATFHYGTCDVCGEDNAVTEPRDFGYLSAEWKRDYHKS